MSVNYCLNVLSNVCDTSENYGAKCLFKMFFCECTIVEEQATNMCIICRRLIMQLHCYGVMS